MHSLPIFLRLEERPVILLGEGEAAAAKRRLLERCGARIVGEEKDAALAIVAIEDEGEGLAAIARLKARGILVNAVDRPDFCDFTLPAIVDRDPVLIAVATGGASAGLAAALRQRIEALLPASLGPLAQALADAREAVRARWPHAAERRRAIAAALTDGGLLDPLKADAAAVVPWVDEPYAARAEIAVIALRSDDPDELTLREARLLASADRVYFGTGTPAVILDRARADAVRIEGIPDDAPSDGLWVVLSH